MNKFRVLFYFSVDAERGQLNGKMYMVISQLLLAL